LKSAASGVLGFESCIKSDHVSASCQKRPGEVWHVGIRDTRGTLSDMKSNPIDDTAWTARHDLVVQIASPEVAAEKLGRTVESVLARRLELGLPDPLSSRERRERQKKE